MINSFMVPIVPIFSGGGIGSESTNGQRFMPLGGTSQDANVANREVITRISAIAQRAAVNITANTKDANWTVRLIDDGSVAVSVTVTAGNTGSFESALGTNVIASGSKLCWAYSTTGSASGSFSLGSVYFQLAVQHT